MHLKVIGSKRSKGGFMVVVGSLQSGRRLTVETTFAGGREVIVLIDGEYSRSFDRDTFHLAMVLEFAPELLELDPSMA